MHCEFDELIHNILHNQIIKTTIGNLRAKLSRLEDQLAKTKQSRQTV